MTGWSSGRSPAKAIRPADEVLRARIELSWKIYRELARGSLPTKPVLCGNPSNRVLLDLSEDFTQLLRRP